jgi:transcriptional regulator NrdR family protein
LRSAFALANTYGLKTLAIPVLKIIVPKQEFIDKIIKGIFSSKSQRSLTQDEVFNVITAIAREFSGQSLEEVVIYR